MNISVKFTIILPSRCKFKKKPFVSCRRGSCKKANLGLQCEIGLRTRTFHILSGSVLSVWSKVESVLAGMPGGSTSKMQIIRLKTDCGQRIVGKLYMYISVSSLFSSPKLKVSYELFWLSIVHQFQTNLANGLRVIDSNFEKGIWFKLYKLALWQVDELVPVKKTQRSVDKLVLLKRCLFHTQYIVFIYR